jgi:hypothetical protein
VKILSDARVMRQESISSYRGPSSQRTALRSASCLEVAEVVWFEFSIVDNFLVLLNVMRIHSADFDVGEPTLSASELSPSVLLSPLHIYSQFCTCQLRQKQM